VKVTERFIEEFGGEQAWAQRCFGVLDEKSAADGKTMVIAAVDEDAGGKFSVAAYRCEFACCIDQLIYYEEEGMDVAEDVPDLVRGEGVFTLERFNKVRMG
jgi:hypothetical protein